MTISRIRGHASAERTITKFGVRGRVVNLIICVKFYRNRLSGYRAARGRKWGSSIDFDRRPYNKSALYRAACDADDIKHVKIETGNRSPIWPVAAPEFFGCRGTARAPEFRLGHLRKIMRSFLVSIRSLLLHCKNEWWCTW